MTVDRASEPPADRLSGSETGRSLSQKMLGRLLHLYFRIVRGMTLGVRAAVLDGEGRVFLVRHTYTPGWHLPGGGVEVGETLEQALAKELREEGCIRLTGPVLLHGVFFNRAMSRRDHVAVFVVREFVAESVKQPDREIAEAGFFSLETLPEGTTPATRRRLDEIAAGERAPVVW
ncbi:ADP-ribose pyrophosphatase YjhB (NUDIX family) [Bosea sp. BE125]|nr:ADP-ribose pyrophosphatase YjhB (NUDIX family) [Bosea sp. BE125]